MYVWLGTEIGWIMNKLRIVFNHFLRPRALVKIIAFHVVGQPKNRDSGNTWARIWNAIFLGNRLVPTIGRYQFFGQDELDREICNLLQLEDPENRRERGFFVEVGSNDGITFSNCKHFELFHEFEGILIEPYSPNLELSRLHRKGPHFIQAAVVPGAFKGEVVELEFSNLMTRMMLTEADEQSSFEFAEMGKDFLYENQQRHKFWAPAQTLIEILDRCGSPETIDLLSLDIEGLEIEVLEGFDFDKYRFKVIVVESFDLPKTTLFFESKGYQLHLAHPSHNLVFVPK